MQAVPDISRPEYKEFYFNAAFCNRNMLHFVTEMLRFITEMLHFITTVWQPVHEVLLRSVDMNEKLICLVKVFIYVQNTFYKKYFFSDSFTLKLCNARVGYFKLN